MLSRGLKYGPPHRGSRQPQQQEGQDTLCFSLTQATQASAHLTPTRKFTPDQVVTSLVGYLLPETFSPTYYPPTGRQFLFRVFALNWSMGEEEDHFLLLEPSFHFPKPNASPQSHVDIFQLPNQPNPVLARRTQTLIATRLYLMTGTPML